MHALCVLEVDTRVFAEYENYVSMSIPMWIDILDWVACCNGMMRDRVACFKGGMFGYDSMFLSHVFCFSLF